MFTYQHLLKTKWWISFAFLLGVFQSLLMVQLSWLFRSSGWATNIVSPWWDGDWESSCRQGLPWASSWWPSKCRTAFPWKSRWKHTWTSSWRWRKGWTHDRSYWCRTKSWAFSIKWHNVNGWTWSVSGQHWCLAAIGSRTECAKCTSHQFWRGKFSKTCSSNFLSLSSRSGAFVNHFRHVWHKYTTTSLPWWVAIGGKVCLYILYYNHEPY